MHQEQGLLKDQVELLQRERDRLLKHHKQLEAAWSEVCRPCRLSKPLPLDLNATVQEILLLERQNTQLQETLTRTSAAADRATTWAKDAEKRLQAVSSTSFK